MTDGLLATPLIVALFVLAPALLEEWTQRSGVFIVIACFGGVWMSMFQLRLYALCVPSI